MSIAIKDVVPYVNYVKGGKNTLIPVTFHNIIHLPATVAVLVNDDSNESVSFVRISAISLTEENTTLTLHVSPVKYYEGEALCSFNSGKMDINNLILKKFDNIGLYIEEQEQTKENYKEDCAEYCSVRPEHYNKCTEETCGKIPNTN